MYKFRQFLKPFFTNLGQRWQYLKSTLELNLQIWELVYTRSRPPYVQYSNRKPEVIRQKRGLSVY